MTTPTIPQTNPIKLPDQAITHKSGFKSSEFWLTLIAGVVSLFGQVQGFIPEPWGTVVAAIVTTAYTIARTILKGKEAAAGVSAVLFLLTTTAHAGALTFNAAAAESLEAGSASCQVNVNQGNSGNHTWTSRDCDTATQEGFVWHFAYPSDNPATVTPAMSWTSTATPAGGNDSVCWDVDCGCSEPTVTNYSNISYGSTINVDGTLTTANVEETDNGSAMTCASSAAGRSCSWRIKRDISCPDDLSADAKTIKGRLTW